MLAEVSDGDTAHHVASFGTAAGDRLTELVEVWSEAGVDVNDVPRPD